MNKDLPLSDMSEARLTRRGIMLVLSSPSGAGKTTLANMLIAADPNCTLSISATTRDPRPGEAHGKDYFFMDRPAFEAMRERGALLEWAEVFGNLYGTPRDCVELALSRGRDIVFDIDWQGTRQLHAEAPGDLVRVFILPPSHRALATRLRGRASDSDEVVARRMEGAAAEMRHWHEYDYVLVNRELSDTLDTLRAILAAERCRRDRNPGLTAFVDELLAED